MSVRRPGTARAVRRRVSPRSVSGPTSAQNCLGRSSPVIPRVSPRRRTPSPPARITAHVPVCTVTDDLRGMEALLRSFVTTHPTFGCSCGQPGDTGWEEREPSHIGQPDGRVSPDLGMSKGPVALCYILAKTDARVTPSTRGSRLKEQGKPYEEAKGRDMKAFVAAALSVVIAVSMSPILSPAQVHGAILLATARQDIG